jgi:CheY-like chemotaxis protein
MIKAFLLAEDSHDDEFVFKRTMRTAGIQNPTMVVHDGVETIAYLEGKGAFNDREQFPLPAVLFLDLKMPRVDGWGVLAWLKTQPRLGRMLVVVLTQWEETTHLAQAYSLGAHSFLIKPITLLDLEDLIRHFPGYWMHTSPAPEKLPSPDSQEEEK